MIRPAIGLLALAFLLASGAPAGAGGEMPYYDHSGMWGGGPGMMFGWFMMAVFVIVAIVAVVLLVRWIGAERHAGAPRSGPGPLDILEARFARGEIDRAEFEDRKRALGG